MNNIEKQAVLKNIINADLQLLERSFENIEKYEFFIIRKKKQIESLEEKLKTNYKNIKKLLNESSSFWKTLPEMVKINGILIKNIYHPTYNETSDEWLIKAFNPKLREVYEKGLEQCSSINEEIITLKKTINLSGITVFFPKHTGKPESGTTIYPERQGKIIPTKWYQKTFIDDNGNEVVEPIPYEWKWEGKTAKEILNSIRTLHTPVKVNIENYKNVKEYLITLITSHIERLQNIPDEDTIKLTGSLIIPELKFIEKEKEQKAKINNTPVHSLPLSATKHKYLPTSRQLLGLIKNTGTTITSFLQIKGENGKTLEEMALNMPHEYIEPEEMSQFYSKKVKVQTYDFEEYDKAKTLQIKEMEYIDPKFYHFNDLEVSGLTAANEYDKDDLYYLYPRLRLSKLNKLYTSQKECAARQLRLSKEYENLHKQVDKPLRTNEIVGIFISDGQNYKNFKL